MDFNTLTKSTEKEFSLGGGYFKFPEGETRFRLLACATKASVSHYVANKPIHCPGKEKCKHHDVRASVKYATYILDRADNTIKLVYMPYSIIKTIGGFQLDEDYSFDDLPMPYDIKVKYDSNAAPADMYKTIPSPKKEPITPDVVAELSKKKPLNEIVEQTNEKYEPEEVEDEKPVTEEDVPF